MRLNELARKLHVVGDQRRLTILCSLLTKEQLCVSEIAAESDLSVATTSHHLQVLQEEGVLTSVRDGKRICYALSDEPFVGDLRTLICKFKSKKHGKS